MSSAAACLPALAWVALDALRLEGARRALRRRRESARSPLPSHGSVVVLQAVRGGDPTLAESLAENLGALAPLGFELRWLLDEDDPVGRAAAAEACTRHPGAAVELELHAPCPDGLNPKLFKLEAAWRRSAAAVILVLDDDARLPPPSAAALVGALADDGVGVATALPAYLPGRGLGSRLLAAFVNDNAGLTYLPLLALRPALTLNGMAWALRRERLHDIGGFAPCLRQLTDDLAVARAVLARGRRIEQLAAPVWMRTELAGVHAYLRQMHRWMLFARLLLRAQAFSTRVLILASQGLPALLPPAALVTALLRPGAVTALGFAAAFAFHLASRRRLQRACAGVSAPLAPLASLIVALLQPGFLLWAWSDRTIRWRDRRYRVHDNERFEAV